MLHRPEHFYKIQEWEGMLRSSKHRPSTSMWYILHDIWQLKKRHLHTDLCFNMEGSSHCWSTFAEAYLKLSQTFNIVASYNYNLPLSWRRPLWYRNQSTDWQSKSMDWFLYDNGPRHERVNWVLNAPLFCAPVTKDKSLLIPLLGLSWLKSMPLQPNKP